MMDVENEMQNRRAGPTSLDVCAWQAKWQAPGKTQTGKVAGKVTGSFDSRCVWMQGGEGKDECGLLGCVRIALNLVG